MASQISDSDRALLEALLAAVRTNGWFPTAEQFRLDRNVEAIDSLERRGYFEIVAGFELWTLQGLLAVADDDFARGELRLVAAVIEWGRWRHRRGVTVNDVVTRRVAIAEVIRDVGGAEPNAIRRAVLVTRSTGAIVDLSLDDNAQPKSFLLHADIHRIDVAEAVARASASEETAESVAQPPESDDEALLPVDSRLERFSLADTTREVLAAAIRLTEQRALRAPELHTSVLLFAFVEIGRRGLDSPTARFVYSVIGEANASRYEKERSVYLHGDARIGSGMPASVPRLTPNFNALLIRAESIAEATSPSRTIWPRHLFAALLTAKGRDGRRTGAAFRLSQMGINAAELQEQLLALILDTTPGDDAEAWRNVLSAPVRIPDFDADNTEGEDWLQFDRDAKAFAALIASRELSPPMSVGIFGEWGSGKSFFMRRISAAVDALGRSGARGQLNTYLPEIVQIDFNAWHYVESNLWASLVDHIFTRLHEHLAANAPPQDPADVARKKLATERLLQEEARARLDHAKKDLARTEAHFEAVQAKQNELSLSLSRTAAMDAWRDIRASKQLPKGVVEAVEGLFGRTTSGTTRELRGALRDIATLGGQVRWLLRAVARPPLLLLLGFVVALGFGVFWLVRTNYEGDYRRFLEIAASLAATLVSSVAAVRKPVREAVSRLATVRKQAASIEAELNAPLTKAENDVAASKLLVEDAAHRVGDAAERVRQAQLLVEEESVGRRLATFIEERARGEDYRRHLGVVAMIRRDFAKLSDLMMKARAERDKSAATTTPFVDRIVLYIDDLDRCPPDRVVQVLQAIHLILAFKLFVVVVGVDSRWIAESLAREYPHLIVAARSGAERDRATPLDYLEKIFQIPFWLTPLDEHGRLTMMLGLFGPATLARKGSTVSTRANGPTVDASPPPTPNAPEIASRDGDSAPRTDVAEHAGEAKFRLLPSEIDSRAERLAISEVEIAFVEGLAPSVASSPRRLKRFVNIYRLIKARLDPTTYGSFLSRGTTIAPYRAVLTLLAVVTNAPDSADQVLAAIARAPKNKRLAELCEELTVPASETLDGERGLAPLKYLVTRDERATAGGLREWIDVVGRFSFRLHHVGGGGRRANRRRAKGEQKAAVAR